MKPMSVIISTADPNLCGRIERLLHGYESVEECGPAFLCDRLRVCVAPPVVITSHAPGRHPSGLELALKVRTAFPLVPVILIAGTCDPDAAADSFRIGVTDYLREPLSRHELAEAIQRCGATSDEPRLGGEECVIGNSTAMREIKGQIRRIAATGCNVLITGETGTGKELIAELLHRNSPGKAGPLVCVNCAAIPETLLESELFGHEKGAFTGAVTSRAGKLEQAVGGTVFFDEIGEMTAQAQSKLLRAIETRRVDRLGGSGGRPVNIRIVAATNRELEQMVEAGDFRSDLYFRLSVVRLHLPPLRERKQDIPDLLCHFVNDLNSRFGRQIRGLSDESVRQLVAHDWPGNVRELKNVLESSFVELPFPSMRYLELSEAFRRRVANAEEKPSTERDQVLSALMYNNWNKSRAAEQLHWSRMTLYRKMAKYQLAHDKAESA